MPSISIVIPAYNVAPYIAACLASVTAQTFSDLEVLVINDASTDGTSRIAHEAARHDRRIRVIDLPENRGLHLVRALGAAEALGTYTLYLDGDDELAPFACEKLAALVENTPADIVHFGVDVIAESDMAFEEVENIARANRNTPPLTGSEILHAIFDESLGYKLDWRIIQRMFRTALLKSAFDAMTDKRLERAEDGYEMFVIASLANSHVSDDEMRGYRYHYGRGVTGTSGISLDTFDRFCKQFKACLDAARDYTAQHASPALQTCYNGFEHQDLVLLANDWRWRVSDTDKPEAARLLAATFGTEQAATQIYRLIRDRLYELVAAGRLLEASDPVHLWLRTARDLDASIGTPPSTWRYCYMKERATSHLRELEERESLRTFDSQDIRIFVTTHKRVDVPASAILQPVQVGDGLRSNRFTDTLHDDEGDNISDKNPMYCELTTQYWAWKNTASPYVGFCHYRRYFNFTDTHYQENPFGEVMDDFIDDEAIKRYGLDDETIRSCIDGYDVVTTGFHDLSRFPGDFATPNEHYAAAPYLHKSDLDRMARITTQLYPEYQPDVESFLNGHLSCFCNMYIMRRDLFDAYCTWLFPILDRFVEETDMSHYSKEALRTPGHLAERLFNIYYLHHQRTKADWKTKQLQCVHFTNPERRDNLLPLTETYPVIERYRPGATVPKIVPIVFASDNSYVPMVGTTICSLLSNASPDRLYDIVILEKDISEGSKRQLHALVDSFKYANLRFYNVAHLIAGRNLVTNNGHISLETYYRFLVQGVLPFYDKVLYLDSDLVIEGDVAQLFDTNLGDNLIGAVRDVDYLGNLNMKDGKRLAYSRDVLHMADPYAYFQAGVLILNTQEMRTLHSTDEWMDIVSSSTYIYDDQDILNSSCEGRVVYLDYSWNVMHDCGNRIRNVFTFAPASEFDAYMASRNHPCIIHYAGFEKPWKYPDCDFAGHFWHYAKMTPFYEQLLAKTCGSAPSVDSPLLQHEPALSPESKLRQLIDPIAPIGSARREVIKSIARTVQGKK